jgi:two-component system chemotaxis sensor kinase CheA
VSADLQEQFIRDMLTESFEGLDRYDRAILLLEKGSADRETLNDIFRVIHTLKGTAGCLGFHRIEKISHAGENLLDALRNEKLAASAPIAASLLRLSDNLRALLQSIENTGGDKTDTDHSALIAELTALRDGHSVPAPASATAAAPTPVAPPPAEAAPAVPSLPMVAADASWGLFDDVPVPAPTAETPSTETPSAASAPVNAPAPAAPPPPPAPAAPITTSTVRVDVALLDKLMNLVGELVLSRNQLMQQAQSRHLSPKAIAEVSQRLNLVTTELQEGVMKTRMQPIGNVWAKFPRIVRDIAHELGKDVHLETVGATTELDRTIIESIRDPLTHIVRNSIDHGIESPEKRTAAGKAAQGHILMRAYHEGGQVNIEIIDDGAGINLTRVRQKAVERGLITTEEAARLSDREATQLIFLPGFSTAEKITNVSGRGVGMDVVKTNIEKIGGSVDVHSNFGQGTTLKIKIPLTLAIVPALIVRAGGERFAIPQVSLVELMRLEGAAATAALETVYDSPVFRLRGNLLPLVFLHRELKLPAPPAEDPVLNIVVLQADQRTFGLVVDTVCDTEEIVVKPLGKHLKGLPMFAGATIMGDGRVALILDALGLAQHARVVNEQLERARKLTGNDTASEQTAPKTQLLLFSLPGRPRLALPLEQAARLEEFSRDLIEFSGAREAVQYRGAILPLVRLSRHLPGATAHAAESDLPLQVIVYRRGEQSFGLVVGEIHDIIEEVVEIQPGSRGPGIVGSAIVQGRITDLVDVPGLLRNSGAGDSLAA